MINFITPNFGIDALIGIAVGDALGVPVEFVGRMNLRKNPVTGMRGFGTHHQPPGTWSDDSSLTLCLADSLCKGYNPNDICDKFIAWYQNDLWTATGHVFDVGGATLSAIEQLIQGTSYLHSGMTGEQQNGNGSLMRILPIAFYLQKERDVLRRFQVVQEVSAITHAHFRSVLGCFIYIEIVLQILKGEKNKQKAYEAGLAQVFEYEPKDSKEEKEFELYKRVLNATIADAGENTISGSGYVLHALEASLWCWLRHDNYADAVLAAVNLGSDTDTTAAITGGLAGLTYGAASIPEEWLAVLKRKDDIEALGMRLFERYAD